MTFSQISVGCRSPVIPRQTRRYFNDYSEVSFKPNGFSAEVIAQVVKLMAELENSAIPESNLDPIASPVEAEVKATKPRKSRVFTDEQKAAFRARMIAGRKAKEDAKADESKPIRTVKIAEAKKSTKAELVEQLD